MRRALARLFRKLGPGFITGASDDDPSGIGTYSMAGARAGFHFLWTPIITLPLMIAIQEMCARIALVTGRGLAGVLKHHYSRWSLYSAVSLLFIANVINIGVDIGAMAAAVRLLVPVPFGLLVVGLTTFSIILAVLAPYRTYAKYLKWLAFSLVSYIIAGLLIKGDPAAMIGSIFRWPALSWAEYVMIFVAIVGTTISPYLFFWQASEEVEEEIAIGRTTIRQRVGATPAEVKSMRVDVFIGMLISNVVMFFIIFTVGATLFTHGITDITTAEQAAAALAPLAGNYAVWLFTLGIIGTGLLAIPVLAGSASYALAEAFHFRFGLDRKFREAHGFYGVLAVAMLVGMLVNFVGVNPMTALFYTAILNGLLAPPLLFLILRIANNRRIMGEYSNGPLANTFGYLTLLVMTVAGLALVANFFLT